MPTPESQNTIEQRDTIRVDPERLSPGTWSHEHNRQVGEGDIAASYSGDVIAMHGRVRKPFRLRGCFWIATGICMDQTEAYRLDDERVFEGVVTTYTEKSHHDGGKLARNDPNGFYHGMAVQHGGNNFVLSGPPVTLVAGDPQPVQGLLFE